MCLAVPMKVKNINGDIVTAEAGQVEYEVNIGLLEDLKEGDYIIVHAGFAIQKMDEKAAQESLQAWQKVSEKKEEREGTGK